MHYIKDHIKIYVYAMPVLDSRMYISLNGENEKEALIIDPLCNEEALPVIRDLSHADVLLTHSHYDHISGVNWLREQLDITVCCSEICAEKMADCDKNLAAFSSAFLINKTDEERELCFSFFDMDYTCQADNIYKKEFSYSFGSYFINTVYTPGHSDCSQCIELRTDREKTSPDIVFTGDSLVNGFETITRFPTGNKKDFREITLPYLNSLPGDTLIMPGHGDWGKKEDIALN